MNYKDSLREYRLKETKELSQLDAMHDLGYSFTIKTAIGTIDKI